MRYVRMLAAARADEVPDAALEHEPERIELSVDDHRRARRAGKAA